jgi:hypothetical protein
MRRVANTFTAFYGSNGVNWIQFANTNLDVAPFASVLYVGLGTTAHNNGAGQATTASYEDYGRILPVITTQPADQTVSCQDDATFTVVATGDAPLSYQWYQGATSLTGETGDTLTLHHVTPANNGNYHVVVTNPAGSVPSSDAALTVTDNVAPMITVLGSNPATVQCHTGYTDAGATASDACAGDLTSSIAVSGTVNVNVPGQYLIHYNVSDPSGNPAVEATRTVNVVDTLPPSVTCPANISVCTSSNSARVTFTLPTATDSCDAAPGVSASPASGSDFPVGTTTVTLTATDASGNSGECTFTVTVTHADAPTLTVISYSGGTFSFSFPSQNNCVYLIQYKDTVTASEWTTLQSVTGDGAVKTVEDTTAPASSRFYQVKVQ